MILLFAMFFLFFFPSSEQDSSLSKTPLQAEQRSGDKAVDENGTAARFSSTASWLAGFLLTWRISADLTGVCVKV